LLRQDGEDNNSRDRQSDDVAALVRRLSNA
jgi:hypothetical protein